MQLTVRGRKVPLTTGQIRLTGGSHEHHRYPLRAEILQPSQIKNTFKFNLRLVEHESQCSTENRAIVINTLVDPTVEEVSVVT